MLRRAIPMSRRSPLSAPCHWPPAQEKSTAPAWKTIPSWYLIGRQDEVINPDAQRFMAKRAHAHTIAINSSHVSYMSHPGTVTKLILRAARKVGSG